MSFKKRFRLGIESKRSKNNQKVNRRHDNQKHEIRMLQKYGKWLIKDCQQLFVQKIWLFILFNIKIHTENLFKKKCNSIKNLSQWICLVT